MQEYWYKHEAYTYVLLDSPERKAEIEREFPVMAEKYKTDEALKNKTWGVSLIPLADIHLTPQVGYEAETKGNRSSMIALIFAAIAILAIAWINYNVYASWKAFLSSLRSLHTISCSMRR